VQRQPSRERTHEHVAHDYGPSGNGLRRPTWIPDATSPDRGREEQQLSITVKAASDEKEYAFNLPITDKTVGLQQLEQWQHEGKLITVYSSTVRALPIVHDTSKDAEGNPLKKYQRAGKKVTVGQGLTIETDAFVVFSAYDVRLAGQANLDQEAQQAHGEHLKRQAEYRRRSVQTRIEKAKQLVEERRAQAKAQVQASANGAPAATAGAGRKSA